MYSFSSLIYQEFIFGLPWWRSGWESACQCGGHGFEPWSGKIPRAAERLGPWATTTGRARLEPVLHSKRGRDSERPATAMKSGPRSPQPEKALAQKRRPNTAINKKKIKKKNWLGWWICICFYHIFLNLPKTGNTNTFRFWGLIL